MFKYLYHSTKEQSEITLEIIITVFITFRNYQRACRFRFKELHKYGIQFTETVIKTNDLNSSK